MLTNLMINRKLPFKNFSIQIPETGMNRINIFILSKVDFIRVDLHLIKTFPCFSLILPAGQASFLLYFSVNILLRILIYFYDNQDFRTHFLFGPFSSTFQGIESLPQNPNFLIPLSMQPDEWWWCKPFKFNFQT